MVFIELPVFIRCAANLFNDDQLAHLQMQLVLHPDAGDLIPGGKGLRKLRVPLGGKGKRGGARVIYLWEPQVQRCYLVYAYAKSAHSDLTRDQLHRLAALMQEGDEGGQERF